MSVVGVARIPPASDVFAVGRPFMQARVTAERRTARVCIAGIEWVAAPGMQIRRRTSRKNPTESKW
jgi:hypothetical protein